MISIHVEHGHRGCQGSHTGEGNNDCRYSDFLHDTTPAVYHLQYIDVTIWQVEELIKYWNCYDEPVRVTHDKGPSVIYHIFYAGEK